MPGSTNSLAFKGASNFISNVKPHTQQSLSSGNVLVWYLCHHSILLVLGILLIVSDGTGGGKGFPSVSRGMVYFISLILLLL